MTGSRDPESPTATPATADGVLEVCAPSVDFALLAEGAGAHRVELCDNLAEGGTTPSAGAIFAAVQRLSIPVMVMIRPRGGDFVYSDVEMEVMLRDIALAREAGAHGVVLGALDPEGNVDLRRTSRLVEAARPLSVTFHRAFDLSRDLDESMEALLTLGVDRVLTSAGCSSVIDGLEMLQRLTAAAGDTLTVLAGGGVRPHNVAAVLAVPGVREVHIGASRWLPSPMLHRVHGVPMGRPYEPDEYLRETADMERIAGTVHAMSASVGLPLEAG